MPTTGIPAEAGYDGNSPFSHAQQHLGVPAGRATLTAAIVIAPFLALGAGIWLAWGTESPSPTC